MAGGVEESDLAAVVLDLVGADVLSDPAGLRLDDRGLADRVEQGRLAVVDVAHDRDHGRPVCEILCGVLVLLRLELLLGRVLDLQLTVRNELGGDQLDLLVAERLGDGDHLPQAHHHLDDVGDGLAHRGREILHRHARRDTDRTGGRRNRLLRWPRFLPLASLARVLARSVGRVVDHHAALAAAGDGALAGPDRTVWSVRAVSHRRQCKDVPAPDRPARSVEGLG